MQVAVIMLLCIEIGLIFAIYAELHGHTDTSHGSSWNILLIIGGVLLLSTLIPSALVDHAYIVAVVLAFAYQGVLKLKGVEEFLTSYKHKNYFSRNSLGFAQTVGLLACYMAGVGFGRKLYTIDYDAPGENRTILLEHLKLIAGSLAVFLFGYFVFGPTAPELCNLAYIGYISFIITFASLIVFLSERMTVETCSNYIYDGPSKTSRLIYFIISDTLNGTINAFVNLSEISVASQILVMVGYCAVIHGLFAFFVFRKIKLRFW